MSSLKISEYLPSFSNFLSKCTEPKRYHQFYYDSGMAKTTFVKYLKECEARGLITRKTVSNYEVWFNITPRGRNLLEILA